MTRLRGCSVLGEKGLTGGGALDKLSTAASCSCRRRLDSVVVSMLWLNNECVV
jgi:hypothetical protein